MAVDDFEDEGFELVAPDDEPPEGDVELALQEEAVDAEALAPTAPPPPVVGRTYMLDFENGRLVPEGGQPLALYDVDAQRHEIEKVLRTERGAAAVHDDDYGIEGADVQADGHPFDEGSFAELEERIRDALLGSLPWVLEVTEFDAEPDPVRPYFANVSFRVVPDGDDADPIEFDNYPLPTP